MENYEKYAELTKTQDWAGICRLNNVAIDSFGTKKELKVLPKHLEEDEVVFALTSGIMNQTKTSNAFDFGTNTWLVVLTNERFLFLDCAMLTKSVDIQSIRHKNVQAVSSSQGWVFGKVMIDLGSRMVEVDNCNKATVAPFSSLANKWLKELEANEASAVAPSLGGSSAMDELKKLAELHSSGVLTDEEFQTAKGKVLASM